MSNRTWLSHLAPLPQAPLTTPAQTARYELDAALPRLAPGLTVALREDAAMGDGWRLERGGDAATLVGGESGLLYGAYQLLMSLALKEEPQTASAPFYGLRMINCWDNADGTIERGYSGMSLFFDNNELAFDAARMQQLGRMLASVGLNVIAINNVNVRAAAHNLIEDAWLPKLSELAGILRAYGVRLMLSIDFAHPLLHGVDTADPEDPRVQAWWKKRTAAVYAAVPDLAGFLVKADSEHRPGPFTYGRTHAQGANMLARALAPFGGKLVWRCFVYNCLQDWRDTTVDRPKAAYDNYVGLDGQFDDNVILQIKHGPFDFQVREPVSPLLFAMPKTHLALELQLAQEYTGHQIDIYAMAPMWKEIYQDLPADKVRSIAAVSNLGRDDNYTGHPFAAVNLYGYGVLAWNPASEPEAVIRRWCRLSYGLPQAQEDALTDMLLHSRRTYEKYNAPLGIGWMCTPSGHYGPSPSGYEFALWGTYHKANRDAIGIDRTERGTGYTEQYPEPLRSLYANLDTCPDLLKLFFHRLPYDYVMPDGRTLVQRVYDDHFEGYEEVEAMAKVLETLDLPAQDKAEATQRMRKQLLNAREWRDIINTFFHRYSGVEDAHGRKIWP